MKMRMRRGVIAIAFFLVGVLVFGLVHWKGTALSSVESDDFEEEGEGRPARPVLVGKEKQLFLDFVANRDQTGQRVSASQNLDKSNYVNGKLTGTWKYKQSQSGWFGYRVDNSAYDSLNNVFYVVTYAGHLYKLEYEPDVKWTLLNHKVVMNPPSNSEPNPVFFGIHLSDSSFRLIRSNDISNRMEYSDDEGHTWQSGTGAVLSKSPSNQAIVVKNGEDKRIVLHTYNAGYHYLYYSDDYGATYQGPAHVFAISESDMRIVKPYYSDNAYMWVWSKSAKTIDCYKYNPQAKGFELFVKSNSVLDGVNLSSVGATYLDETFHCYVATIIDGNYSVYYSNDEGSTWIRKHSGRDRPFETIWPDEPNTLFSGFEDMRMSQNYGSTWAGFGNKLGWDLQHMRAYEMKGGKKSITLAGLDFGCYVSQSPADKESYRWCNNGAWYAMHYDVASSQNFNSIYMANQDRGATAYYDSGEKVGTIDVDGTDVFRVSYAKRETSIWSWFYYGRIRRRSNFAVANHRTAVYDGLGNWWAAPILASPDPTEDAIYAAYGSKLQKFSYNPVSNAIIKSEHPFDFQSQFGAEIGGFGYSELDRNLWYVALTEGTFLFSNDGGDTWEKSSYSGARPLSQGGWTKNQIVIRVSDTDPNKVYYAGVGNQMLVSEDGGKTFTNKNNGLSVSRIRDFALSPDEKYIFAACGYGGAWVYALDENQWFQMEDDAVPSVDFTDVDFIKRKNQVRFGSFGSGIIEFTPDNVFNPVSAPDELKTNIKHTNHIALNWAHVSGMEEGFYIERATDDSEDFICIDTLEAGVLSYVDEGVEYDQTYFYRVMAFNSSTVSYASNLSIINLPKEGYINKSKWAVIGYSSQESGNLARYAIDNDSNSIWHTQWNGASPEHPHYIEIDLKEEQVIQGFSYLPRQDHVTSGSILDYKLYVSNDASDWGTALSSGKFDSEAERKEIKFNEPVKGRYVRLVAQSEVNGGVYTSAAEIDLLFYNKTPQPPLNLTAIVSNESDIQLTWLDNSEDEKGYILEQLTEGDFFSGGKFEEVATVADSVTSFSFTGLPLDSTYTFRVRAYSIAGVSSPGNVVQVTLEGPLSLRVDEISEIKVYPNPATVFVTVEWSAGLISEKLRLISMSGQVMFEQDLPQQSSSINLSMDNFPTGLYLVEFIDTSGQKVVRRIKKR